MNRLLYIAFVLILCSCMEAPEDFDLDNKYDPQNPNYISPITTIDSGPSEGEIITTSEAIFSWSGNDEIMEFRVHHNNILLSDWSGSTSYKLDYLDEGNHTFSVQGRYSNLDTSLTVNKNFIVDAVKGPSLIFSPRRQSANLGQSLAFEIIAEEVSDVTGTEFVILFDNTILNIDSINVGSMFTLDQDYIFDKKIDNTKGSAKLLIGILGGTELGFTGTGALAKIYMTKKISTETTAIFDGSETFRGPTNNEIQINTTIGGLIINQ